MKKKTEKIDELILKALSHEEAEFYKQLDEPGLPEMIQSIFQGKLAWVNIIHLISQFILFALAIYCTVKFLNTEEISALIKWGAGIFITMMCMSMIKFIQWTQMQQNVLLREIKKLELQVTVLASKVPQSK